MSWLVAKVLIIIIITINCEHILFDEVTDFPAISLQPSALASFGQAMISHGTHNSCEVLDKLITYNVVTL